MQPRRSVPLAVAAVLTAAVPGLVAHWPADHPLERARPTALGEPASAQVMGSTVVADPTTTAPPTTAPPVEEVAIVPPTEPMTGEVAAAAAPPAPQPFRHASGGSEVLALIVGIDDYPGRQHDLSAAVADAEAVDSALAGFGVPVTNRAILRDGQARRENVVGALRDMVSKAGPDTTLVFAYAGHVQKLDRDSETIITAEGAHLTDADLAAILAPARAERMWLLIASCYAAGFTEALAPGRVLTAAAGANSLAYESPTLEGSYLVHHMVREGWLDRRAGDSVQDAFAYADATISSRYPQRRPVQIDYGSSPLRLGASGSTSPPRTPYQSPTSPKPPPSTAPTMPPPTTTEPERRCTLIILNCG